MTSANLTPKTNDTTKFNSSIIVLCRVQKLIKASKQLTHEIEQKSFAALSSQLPFENKDCAKDSLFYVN